MSSNAQYASRIFNPNKITVYLLLQDSSEIKFTKTETIPHKTVNDAKTVLEINNYYQRKLSME